MSTTLFGNLTNDTLEESQDRLGGFAPINSNIYTGKIKLAYAGQATSGARNVTLILDFNSVEYRETIYITNRKGENWFLNKDDKSKKVPLPGFTTINDICLVTTGEELSQQNAEDKMVKVYDADAKKELPKSVPVLTALLGQEVSLGIIKVMDNKNEKNSNGEYVPTAEVRMSNAIDKVWHTETQMTVPEARAGAKSAGFWPAWLERNKDVTRDKRTIKDGVGVGAQTGTGRTGSTNSGPPAAGAAGATTSGASRKSLFGPKA